MRVEVFLSRIAEGKFICPLGIWEPLETGMTPLDLQPKPELRGSMQSFDK